MQVDLATQNKTKPSCTKVKVEVGLLGDFPKRINVGMRPKNREIKEKWINVKYDYVPKHYKTCKLQDHNEKKCFVMYLELYPKKKEEGDSKNHDKDEMKESGKIVENQ